MKKLILVGYLIFVSLGAQANLIVVNSNQDAAIDDNLCTLREALVAANFDVAYYGCAKGLGDDLIWLLLGTTGDTIQLNNALPVYDGVEIQGPGADNLVLIPSNNHDGHIFIIDTDRNVTFKDFRIGGARSSAVDVTDVQDLLIQDMRFLNNIATNDVGGALQVKSEGSNISYDDLQTIRIIDSEFAQNQALTGGAIYIDKDYLLHVEGSLFENNLTMDSQSTVPNGSAVFKRSSTLDFLRDPDTIINSSFVNNGSAQLSDRGVVNFSNLRAEVDRTSFVNNPGTPLVASSVFGVVKNSLFFGNTADYAIQNYSANGELSVQFSTFHNNGDALIARSNSTIINRGNVFDDDGCEVATGGTILSDGYNIENGSPSCTSSSSDVVDSDPILLPLGLYGGSQLIAPLSPISPAVDGAMGCDDHDLSGEGRPRDGDASGGPGQCDMGAVERPDAYGLTLNFSGTGTGVGIIDEYDLICDGFFSTPCFVPLPRNETFTIQPFADSGSTFVGWSGECTGITPCVVTMDDFKTVEAEFLQIGNPVTLTVVKNLENPHLGVTVTSDPAGISCGNSCQAEFEENDVVTLSAQAEPGALIDGWQNCDLIIQNGQGCKSTLSADATITVDVIADPDVIFAHGFE